MRRQSLPIFRCALLVLFLCTGDVLFAGSDGTGGASFINKVQSLDLPAAGLPVVGYSPETDWEFGAVAACYFNCGTERRRSYIQIGGAYTLKGQWYVNLSSNLYLPANWFVYIRSSYKDYPDSWYGIGNDIRGHLTAMRYTSKRASFTVQPQYRFTDKWSTGLHIDFLRETVSPALTGEEKTLLWGIGAVVQYDSRDKIYYPHSGLFVKVTGAYYGSEAGQRRNAGKVTADVRQFVPLYKELIFAWQFTTDIAIGRDKPFQMLPTIGGQDLLRGVRRNMFRDDLAAALQAELRIPIWSLLKATVFGGIGDVYNLYDWRWATPKVGYGAGVRACFNKAGINVRFDVARSNVNKSWKADGWSFYLTCTESF